MFENYYSFFHYCLLSCRYAMIQKSILNEPKWGGHKQSFVGDGAPGLIVATALATTTKNDNPVGNFVNSRRRVARNSQWGGLFWGSGGGAPSRRMPMGVWRRSSQRRRLGVRGQSPQPPEARGPGGGAPSAQKFCIFFAKITSF